MFSYPSRSRTSWGVVVRTGGEYDEAGRARGAYEQYNPAAFLANGLAMAICHHQQ